MTEQQLTDEQKRLFVMERKPTPLSERVFSLLRRSREAIPPMQGEVSYLTADTEVCMVEIARGIGVPLKNLYGRTNLVSHFSTKSTETFRCIHGAFADAIRGCALSDSHGSTHDLTNKKELVIATVRWNAEDPNLVDYEVLFAWGPKARETLRGLYPDKLF